MYPRSFFESFHVLGVPTLRRPVVIIWYCKHNKCKKPSQRFFGLIHTAVQSWYGRSPPIGKYPNSRPEDDGKTTYPLWELEQKQFGRATKSKSDKQTNERLVFYSLHSMTSFFFLSLPLQGRLLPLTWKKKANELFSLFSLSFWNINEWTAGCYFSAAKILGQEWWRHAVTAARIFLSLVSLEGHLSLLQIPIAGFQSFERKSGRARSITFSSE